MVDPYFGSLLDPTPVGAIRKIKGADKRDHISESSLFGFRGFGV